MLMLMNCSLSQSRQRGGMAGRGKFLWPTKSGELQAVCWNLLIKIAKGELTTVDFAHTYLGPYTKYYQECHEQFIEQVFEPFVRDLEKSVVRHNAQNQDSGLVTMKTRFKSGIEKSAPPSLKVFVNHSSDDAELVLSLVELMKSSMSLLSTDIRCTSLDGYRLSSGDAWKERLRTEVDDTMVLLSVLTASSIKSPMTLFELGARWGAKRIIMPCYDTSIKIEDMPDPIRDIHCVNLANETEIMDLVRTLSELLGVTLDTPSSYHRYIKQVQDRATS